MKRGIFRIRYCVVFSPPLRRSVVSHRIAKSSPAKAGTSLHVHRVAASAISACYIDVTHGVDGAPLRTSSRVRSPRSGRRETIRGGSSYGDARARAETTHSQKSHSLGDTLNARQSQDYYALLPVS